MPEEVLPHFCGVGLQTFDVASFFLGEGRFYFVLVILAVAGEHDFGGGFEFGGLLGKVGPAAALALAGVAGEFDAIYRKHLTAYQALAVTEVEDVAEQRRNLVTQGADEGGKRGVVRGAVTTEGDEGDLFTAGAFYLTTADNAAAIRKQDDFEQHGGWIGGSASLVVLVAGIEGLEVNLMVDQIIQRVLERAGQ